MMRLIRRANRLGVEARDQKHYENIQGIAFRTHLLRKLMTWVGDTSLAMLVKPEDKEA